MSQWLSPFLCENKHNNDFKENSNSSVVIFCKRKISASLSHFALFDVIVMDYFGFCLVYLGTALYCRNKEKSAS